MRCFHAGSALQRGSEDSRTAAHRPARQHWDCPLPTARFHPLSECKVGKNLLVEEQLSDVSRSESDCVGRELTLQAAVMQTLWCGHRVLIKGEPHHPLALTGL